MGMSKEVANILPKENCCWFYGRMEFEQGLKQIYPCRSFRIETIKIINEMVKSRDFWTIHPSILEERMMIIWKIPKELCLLI